MSQPNIPNITPDITLTRDNAVNLVIASVAMEEMGISHILNAEGEKLQYVLGTLPGLSGPPASISDILAVNSSVKSMINAITKNEYVLQQKLETVTNAPIPIGPPGARGVTGSMGELIIDDPLFMVTSRTGTATFTYSDTLNITSNTLEINVTEDTAETSITIENPQAFAPQGFPEYGGYYIHENYGPVTENEKIPLSTAAHGNGDVNSFNGEILLKPGTYVISYSILGATSAEVELRDNAVAIPATRVISAVGSSSSNTIIYAVTAPETPIGLYYIGTIQPCLVLYANITATRIW